MGQTQDPGEAVPALGRGTGEGVGFYSCVEKTIGEGGREGGKEL